MSVVRFTLRQPSRWVKETLSQVVLEGKRISGPPEIRNPIPRLISRRLLAVLTGVFQLVPAYYGIKQIIGSSMYWHLYRQSYLCVVGWLIHWLTYLLD